MVAESSNWLESYSSMEQNMDTETQEEFPAATIEVKPELPSASIVHKLGRRDVRLLLTVRDIIKEYKRQQEEKARALDIKIVNPESVGIDDNSTESYIIRALSTTDDGLHINTIIEAIESMGWISDSKYHKYSHVRKTIAENYFMFQKIAKATFKLREGFRKRVPAKNPEDRRKPIENVGKLTTLEDIIETVIRKRQGKFGMYPAGVWYILKRMGYKFSYTTVHAAMQNDRFNRDGFWYTINANNKNAKSAKSTKQK
jgi:hypothetical protein